MQVKADMDEVFEDYCIDDGHLRYIPRNQLMNAMHMLGLNPTSQSLEDIVPEGDEDTRVRYEEFRICYEAVKHTRGYNREELIAAFQVFDERRTGKLTTAEFLRAMGSSTEDELQGYEQQELLTQADPNQTGWVDYVAFSNLLCPTRKSSKAKKRKKSIEEPKHEQQETPSPIEEVPTETDQSSSPVQSASPVQIDPFIEEKQNRLIESLIRELNITAEQEEQVRNDQKRKLRRCEDEMKALALDRETFTPEQIRPAFRSSNSDFEKLKDTLRTFDRCKDELKTTLEAQMGLLVHKRNRADSDLKVNIQRYKSDPDYETIMRTVEEILICKHRIISNIWTPISVSADSTEGVSQFLSACAGSHSEGIDRGSNPSEPIGESAIEINSFSKGAYLHHGTSSLWDSGSQHGNLMSEELQELCSKHCSNATAIRLLRLPCLLDLCNCGIDDVGEEAQQKRAAFFDGVNGKDCNVEELGLYNYGLWVRNNAKPNNDSDDSYTCSYSLLETNWRCERYISSMDSTASGYRTLVDAVKVEEAALELIDHDANSAIEICKKNWKTEMDYHEEDYTSEMEQIKNSAPKDSTEDPNVSSTTSSSSSSSKPPTSAEQKTTARSRPSPRPKQVAEKKGGGCCG